MQEVTAYQSTETGIIYDEDEKALMDDVVTLTVQINSLMPGSPALKPNEPYKPDNSVNKLWAQDIWNLAQELSDYAQELYNASEE